MKPYSPSCERNQEPILAVISEYFATSTHVLEIGSGTGQHAVYFGKHLPHLTWQTSDLEGNHPGIKLWLAEAALPNVAAPFCLCVSDQPWPIEDVDGIFTANTLHIMSWEKAKAFLQNAATVLKAGGKLCVYGPFNYGGAFTSESNARFEEWLKARDPLSGIRHFEEVCAVAEEAGFVFVADVAMPANNRILVWEKRGEFAG